MKTVTFMIKQKVQRPHICTEGSDNNHSKYTIHTTCTLTSTMIVKIQQLLKLKTNKTTQ